MTIPAFNNSGVLPPYIGDPVQGERSPYRVDAPEVVHRFATSTRRCEILLGWLRLRSALHTLGIVRGFQWLDGSFCEDLASQARDPNDIDVITFLEPPAGVRSPDDFTDDLVRTRPDLTRPSRTKQLFKCDAYYVQLEPDERADVELVHYWYGLFSHRRDDTWKGMVQVPLDPTLDIRAQLAVVTAQAALPNTGGGTQP
jgi:hypothetical protein